MVQQGRDFTRCAAIHVCELIAAIMQKTDPLAVRLIRNIQHALVCSYLTTHHIAERT